LIRCLNITDPEAFRNKIVVLNGIIPVFLKKKEEEGRLFFFP